MLKGHRLESFRPQINARELLQDFMMVKSRSINQLHKVWNSDTCYSAELAAEPGVQEVWAHLL